MRSLLALIALLVIGFGTQLHAVQSEPNAKQSDNRTNAAKQGTENNPVIVKILSSPGDDTRTEKEKHHKDNEARIADATVNLVWVTAALAIFTALLFGATVLLARDARKTSDRQAGEMQESLEISRTAANAATLSANAAVGIELPILKAVPTDLIRVDGPIPPEGPYGGIVINSVPTKYSAISSITFKNHGRTPAFQLFFSAGWKVASGLPDIPIYTHTVGINHAVVIRPDSESPDDAGYMVDFRCGIELIDKEITAITNGTSWLWFYGSVSYRDFMNIEREARFCWRWANRDIFNAYFFASDGEPPPDYIRNA